MGVTDTQMDMRRPPLSPEAEHLPASGLRPGPHLRMHSVWIPLHVRLARQVRVVEPCTW